MPISVMKGVEAVDNVGVGRKLDPVREVFTTTDLLQDHGSL